MLSSIPSENASDIYPYATFQMGGPPASDEEGTASYQTLLYQVSCVMITNFICFAQAVITEFVGHC